MRRDFRIIELEKAYGRRFGHNITKDEFDNILSSDALWPRILYSLNGVYDPSKEGLKYYIRYGAIIDDQIIEAFSQKNIKYIPVILEKESGSMDIKLSEFSKEYSKILTGQIYGCVRKWLSHTKMDICRKAKQSIEEEQKVYEQAITKISYELDSLVTNVINEVLSFPKYLSLLSLYDEMLEDVTAYFSDEEQKTSYNKMTRHNLETAIRSIILGKICGLDHGRLKLLAMAAFLHDLGMVAAYEKCRLAFIDKKIGFWDFDASLRRFSELHPIYGALLLSQSTGEPIEGIHNSIRQAVLQHEQYINGTGPSLYLVEYSEFMELMGITPGTVFLGYNRLPSDVISESHYTLAVSESKICGQKIKRMSVISQILAIAEKYVSYSESVGPEAALSRMVPHVGRRYNGEIFDKFYNTMVPIEHYPNGAAFRLKVPEEHDLSHWNGYWIIVLSKNDSKLFVLVRDNNGKFMTPKVIEREKLKDGVQFVLGEWK